MKNKKIFSLVIVCALVFSMFVAAIPFSLAGKPSANPQIEVEKFVLAGDLIEADEGPGPSIASGPVQFVIGVANTGDVTLSNVELTDASLSDQPVNIGRLAAGDWYFSEVFTVEWAAGEHMGTGASASGVYAKTTISSDTDYAYYTGDTEPAPEPAPTETLTSPNMAFMEDSNFGQSVAAGSGYIAIGAPMESIISHHRGVEWAGRVYVYDETTKNLVGTLESPNSQSDGQFGFALAISGDYLIVGAIRENRKDAHVIDAGRAYVYSLSDLEASPIELVSSNPTEMGEFGWSLAGDGTDVFVGAPDEGAGVVYSYDLATGDLNYAISSPDPVDGYGYFGSAVAVSEGKLYVGDPFINGEVFIYDAATGGTSIGSFSSPTSETNDYFGDRIVAGGGYVFVGADGESSPGGPGYDGLVHVFSVDSEGTATLVKTLASPNPTSNGDFGGSLASDDNKVVIGAPGEIDYAGRAYVYSIADLEADPVTLVSPNQPSGYFGDLNSVAIDNGLIVIGASGEFVLWYDNGRAYIYSPG